jgi:type II secretion system protein N
MNKTNKRILYAAYIIVAAVFFFYYLFPSEAAIKYIASNLTRIRPDLSIEIDHIKPSLPYSLGLHNVRLYHLNNLLFDITRMKITPDLLSLFRHETTFFFKSKTFEGSVKGKITMAEKMSVRQVKIDANFTGVQINDIPVLQDLIKRKISGTLDAKIIYSNMGPDETLNAELDLSDCTFEIMTPLIPLETLSFASIGADVTFNKGRLQIKECIIKGDQMEGKVSGEVTMGDPVGKSVINLSGTIIPQAVLLEDLKKTLPVNLFLNKSSGAYHFPIRLSGTLDSPHFYLE